MNKTKENFPNSIPGKLGRQVIADFWDVENNIESKSEIEEILQQAAIESKATPLKITSYEFNPCGITSVILLAESHISIHTWPELKYVAIDAFTCGEHTIPMNAIDYLRKVFKPQKMSLKEFTRGEK